jgi:hypothetical protein
MMPFGCSRQLFGQLNGIIHCATAKVPSQKKLAVALYRRERPRITDTVKVLAVLLFGRLALGKFDNSSCVPLSNTRISNCSSAKSVNLW